MPEKRDLCEFETHGKRFAIFEVWMAGEIYYGCGVLPLRNKIGDLLKDIVKAQGPEWRA